MYYLFISVLVLLALLWLILAIGVLFSERDYNRGSLND